MGGKWFPDGSAGRAVGGRNEDGLLIPQASQNKTPETWTQLGIPKQINLDWF